MLFCFLLLSVFLPKLIASNCFYDFKSPQLLKAENAILNLNLLDARHFVSNESKQNPHNLALLVYDNYIDYLHVLATEDESLYNQYVAKLSKRIQTIDNCKIKSPYSLFCKAEMMMQWALIKLRFNDQFAAANQIRDAYKLLKENNRLYPDFKPNLKTMGWVEAMSSSLPDSYNWLVKLLGIKNNESNAMAKLELFCADSLSGLPRFFLYEGLLAHGLVAQTIQKNKPLSLSIAHSLNSHANYKLALLFQTTLYHALGKNDYMLKSHAAFSANYLGQRFFYMDFVKGMGLMRKLDGNAQAFLLRFSTDFKGNTNKTVAAYYLAVYYYFESNTVLAQFYLNRAKNAKNVFSEQDKQAKNDALRGFPSSPNLLKARLLMDGAYAKPALHQISLVENQKNTLPIDDLAELYYRKGRIYQQLNQTDLALNAFSTAIEKGAQSKRYFAAYAAFYTGEIYEYNLDAKSAYLWYEKAKKGFPKNTEHTQSLEQKCKAGLSRVRPK